MMKRCTLFFVALLMTALASPRTGFAQLSRTAQASLGDAAFNTTALQPGQQAVAAIVLNINNGFHAQSHTPNDPAFIKFTLKPTPNDNLAIGDPIYPIGETHDYGDLGKLNVYTGQVIVFVPVTVAADAKPGPITFTGKLKYQCCDATSCYPPSTTPFTIASTVIPAGQPLETQKPELFKTYQPVGAAPVMPATGPATSQPTTAPASVLSTPPTGGVAMPPSSADIDFFGLKFSLQKDSFALPLSLAFLVGVIFNLVPCVLPVLPLKAIAFYEVSQHNRARSLLLGLVFSAGIVSLFGLLALLIIVQHRLSWGAQFSNPWFVWPLVILLVLMAAGMFGAFSLNLPVAVYRFSPRHDTLVGNYLFGILTAVLSTPCTAPMFPGLLLWAALEPVWLGVAVLLVVGAGMAFPYLLLSGFPELARKFPRSGPWPEVIKQYLGFLILAVAVYIAGGRISHSLNFLWLVFAVITAGSIFLVARALTLHASIRGLTLILLISGGITFGAFQYTRSLTHIPINGGIPWQPYTPDAFAQARSQHRIVLVEFTANWCVNCLELESRVFRNPAAAETLNQHHVIPLRADLTDSDAPGEDKLRELNPDGGIPLTAIYSPGSEEPIRLSSTYSLQNLIDAVNKASEQ